MRHRFILQRLPAMLLPLVLAASASADVTVGDWNPIFQGIDFATGSTQIDGSNPDQQAVSALRIDLQNPNISFYTTPQSGPLETTTQTTRDFVAQNHLAVAINANFWNIKVNPYVQEQVDLVGLAISNGTVVSPANDSSAALTVTADNHAAITPNASVSVAGIYTAISGSGPILTAGVNVADVIDTSVEPRTSAGISQDGRYLILMTIDGRNPGYSDGATFSQTADWMLRWGAYDAINLDGGGSTTMARDDGAGNAVLLDIPSGPEDFPVPGLERLDGNNLGVYALPLAVPEPASLAFALAAFAPLFYRRRRGAAIRVCG